MTSDACSIRPETAEDLSTYEMVRRSQAEAVAAALSELATGVVEFLDEAP